MTPHEALYKKRVHRRHGGAVEGRAPKVRLDRKAKGGSVRAQFNAAIHDDPARPTIDESGPLPAVHNRARGGALSPEQTNALVDKDQASFDRGYKGWEVDPNDPDDIPLGNRPPIEKRPGMARGGPTPDMGWVDGQPGKERAKGGRLTAGERQAMPSKDFALPGKGAGPKGAGAGSYPIPDAKHGRLALADVSKHGGPAEQKAVRAKVRAKYPGIA